MTELPNVGTVLAERLAAAGIATPTVLRRIGSVEAALRIRKLSPGGSPCASMLYALEGAIQGIRWHALSQSERAVLWQRYQSRLGKQDREK